MTTVTTGDTGSSAIVACAARFDPFGNPTDVPASATGACSSGSTASTAFFRGERRDPGTGNYQMGSRTYDPSKASFLTPDSYRDGDAHIDQGVSVDPLTRNRYTYVNGDPVNYIDPTGHDGCAAEEETSSERACSKSLAKLVRLQYFFNDLLDALDADVEPEDGAPRTDEQGRRIPNPHPGPPVPIMRTASGGVGYELITLARVRRNYVTSVVAIEATARKMVADGTLTLREAAEWAVNERNSVREAARTKEPLSKHIFGDHSRTFDDAMQRYKGDYDLIIQKASSSNPKVNRSANRMRFAGRALVAIDVGISVWEVTSAEPCDRYETAGRNLARMGGAAVGAVAGTKAGGSVGGAIGMIGGPPGAAIGAGIGGFVGAVGGALVGGFIGHQSGGAIGRRFDC